MKKISTNNCIIRIAGLFVCFGLGLVAYITSYNSLVDVLKETMPSCTEASVTIEDGIQNQQQTEYYCIINYMNILNRPDADDSAVRAIISDDKKIRT